MERYAWFSLAAARRFHVGEGHPLRRSTKLALLLCYLTASSTSGHGWPHDAAWIGMVVLKGVRTSPGYLYVKTYCLCALVTLLRAAPVSSRLPRIGETLQLNKHKIIYTRLGPRIVPVDHDDATSAKKPGTRPKGPAGSPVGKFTLPTVLVVSPEMIGQWAMQSGPRAIVRRWIRRAVDLSKVKGLLRRDDADHRAYPEIRHDALVRRSSSLHPEEVRFIKLRKQKISCDGNKALHHFLELPQGEKVDPRDVPLMALGGSGGGYRAMYGLAAFFSASKKLGLWECLTWTAGVSGSCWTLAAYYTVGHLNTSSLIKHYLSMAKEVAHPMSMFALNTVARSSKGVYFLIGPLVRKARNGIIGLGIMDIFATLTTTYQFLSREPGARLSRATFQFSKLWTRCGIADGNEPMPILTAVRKAPPDSTGVKPRTDSSNSKGHPPDRALEQHQTPASHAIAEQQRLNPEAKLAGEKDGDGGIGLPKGFFQWFEITPVEVGCPDVEAYVPTWSYGRPFISGRSIRRQPEQSLSLLLGQCTGAPAGPLSGYISALLASLPKGTFMSRMLLLLNNFVRMKRWENWWGNPIRAGHDPNPFYGLQPLPANETGQAQPTNTSRLLLAARRVLRSNWIIDELGLDRRTRSIDTIRPEDAPNDTPEDNPDSHDWESQTRVRLMDGGMSNNLPNHILARPERGADIIIAFDASSDVLAGSAVKRIHNFAEDCNIDLAEQTALFELPKPRYQSPADGTESAAALEVESKYLKQYARVFRGTRPDGAEMYVIYCPLLPNGVNPDFNPSTASFSNSYNLVWTPAQVNTLLATSEANVRDYAIDVIRQVTRKVYLAKKAQRLNSSSP